MTPPPASEVDRTHGYVRHHGVGGAFVRPAEDISLMHMSSSGMSRCSSSGSLDIISSSCAHREPSPSNMSRAGSSNITGVTTSTAYVGPFGHLGEDPDKDGAAVTTDHGPHDEE